MTVPGEVLGNRADVEHRRVGRRRGQLGDLRRRAHQRAAVELDEPDMFGGADADADSAMNSLSCSIWSAG